MLTLVQQFSILDLDRPNYSLKYLLNTSVYLVHWQGGSTTKNVFRNIWMFYNEIELLSKVSSSKGENKGEKK